MHYTTSTMKCGQHNYCNFRCDCGVRYHPPTSRSPATSPISSRHYDSQVEKQDVRGAITSEQRSTVTCQQWSLDDNDGTIKCSKWSISSPGKKQKNSCKNITHHDSSCSDNGQKKTVCQVVDLKHRLSFNYFFDS